MPSPTEIRQEITRKIVDALEAGAIPWRRPWSVSKNAVGCPANIVSHKGYRGINILLLSLHSMKRNFRSRWWATFDQIKNAGGMVKRRPADVEPGEWGCRVVFFKPLLKTVTNKVTGEEREEQIPLLRTYTVFNVDQCDGEALDRFRVIEEPGHADAQPDFKPAEQLIDATCADIRHGGEQAFYRFPTPDGAWPHHTDGDYICVPQRKRFTSLGMYYETLLHELGHWTEIRLGWDRKGEGYAMGELIAELSATMLAAELGIPQGEDLENHAAYLKDWLDAMKADPSFVFKAATQASKVADFLLSFVPKADAVDAPVAVSAA